MMLLVLRVMGSLYAIDVTRVVEVAPRVDLRKLPHAPGFLVGVLDYQGIVVPVLDLAIMLGGQGSRNLLSTRLILVDVELHEGAGLPHRRASTSQEPGGDIPRGQEQRPEPRRRLLGLIGEQVSDVIAVSVQQYISPPIALPQAPYLGEIVEIHGETAQIFLVNRLLPPSFQDVFYGGDKSKPETVTATSTTQTDSP
jgi:chemotaxis-related protein WspB